ncbi:MAG: uracil phosphoribosyltransferase [Bacteroidales bacterium]|nr:uracil phosphoribosyltransferase [Bacteroidales bacterium]MBQ6101959.1 uracil phosphoribosyltransferase [Bacteroidales bacterium]
MKIINFADSKSVINQYVAELRDIHIQSDRNTFRHNLQRIGQMMAYEVSKTLNYSEKEVQTPLAMAKAYTHDDEVVLATVFRAGLPFHQGFLDVFDHAGNAFVSAYRHYLDEKHENVGIKVEYLAAPDLTGKTLIIVDPMLATGGSLQLAYETLCTKGTPKHLHLCCVIASKVGVENIMKMFKPLDNVTLWCAAIDPILNEHKYIVPGLGDAGDLAYGDKI